MVEGYEQRAHACHVKLYILSTYLSFFILLFIFILLFVNILFSVGALKISFLSTLISRQSTPVRPLHGGLNRYFNYFSFFFSLGCICRGKSNAALQKKQGMGVYFFFQDWSEKSAIDSNLLTTKTTFRACQEKCESSKLRTKVHHSSRVAREKWRIVSNSNALFLKGEYTNS